MNKKSNRGGSRPGAGRPRRKVPAIPTNLAISKETRAILAAVGDGDMSRGATLLAQAWAWAKSLRAAGHPDPGDEIYYWDESPYECQCPQCGGLATTWEPLDDYIAHASHPRYHCWRGHTDSL